MPIAPLLHRSDKTVMVWQLANNEDGTLGFPKRALRGHSHYVQVGRAGCRRKPAAAQRVPRHAAAPASGLGQAARAGGQGRRER